VLLRQQNLRWTVSAMYVQSLERYMTNQQQRGPRSHCGTSGRDMQMACRLRVRRHWGILAKDHDRQHIIADFTDIEVLGRPVPMYPQNPRTGSLGASILIMEGFMIQKTQIFDRVSCGIFPPTRLPLSWTAFLRLKDGFQVTISTWRSCRSGCGGVLRP
jgi:hypothetical protein